MSFIKFDAIPTQDYFEAGDQLVYSFDDWVGYGFHGDFFNGWKPGVVEALLDQCTYHTPVMFRNPGLGTILDTVSKILKDTAILSI